MWSKLSYYLCDIDCIPPSLCKPHGNYKAELSVVTKDKKNESKAYNHGNSSIHKESCERKKKKWKLQNSQKKNDISKPKFSRRKEITNIGAKINKIETRKTIEKINKAGFFKK